MRKFVFLMFLLAIIGLQFPYYSLMGAEPVMSFKVFKSVFEYGITDKTLGDIIVYLIPFIGLVLSVISILIKKNLSFFTSFVAVIGILYCGYIYFAVTGLEGSVKIGFLINFISYLAALTISVVSIRTKEE
ncbi:MAG: hypothetical protein ACI4VF_07860 [Lachnospirales bacterium]